MDAAEELADLQSRFDLLQGDRKGACTRALGVCGRALAFSCRIAYHLVSSCRSRPL